MAEIYSSLKQERDKKEVKTREDQVNLARLRARTHPALGEYKLKIDAATDATCPRCKSAMEDLEHWLHECPAMSARRMKIFGRHKLEKDILTLEPGKSLELAKASILRNQCTPTLAGQSGVPSKPLGSPSS